MRAGLEQFVQALQSPEAALREERLSHVIYGLTRTLRNNAALVRERQLHPEIARQQIARPVFIVGINRTGTTFLHRLLSRDRRFWALRRYELTESVLASGQYATVAGTADDPRPAYVEELMRGAGIVQMLSGIHCVDVAEPEEDFIILMLAFATWVITVAHHVPAYGRWLSETGSRHAYAHHRWAMQNFTWQRRQCEPGARRQWLQKMAFHLMELEVLLETYPDAVFIQTHRDPTQFMASWNSLVERIRSLTMEPPPRPDAGTEQLSIMSGMLNNAMRFRESRPDLEQRWVGVSYVDLVENPMAVVRHIYERLGWRIEPEARKEMENWLSLQAAQRRGEPPHRYNLEDYGLTPEKVGDAFAPYRDFISSRGVREIRL